jgi:hypothetical protein
MSHENGVVPAQGGRAPALAFVRDASQEGRRLASPLRGGGWGVHCVGAAGTGALQYASSGLGPGRTGGPVRFPPVADALGGRSLLLSSPPVPPSQSGPRPPPVNGGWVATSADRSYELGFIALAGYGSCFS